MTMNRIPQLLPATIGAILVSCIVAAPCPAQFGFGGGGGFGGGMGGGMGGGGGFGGGAGGGQGFAGGVLINGEGVVSARYATSRARSLAQKRAKATSGKHLSTDINRASPLRKISLVRLEQACARLEGKKMIAPLDIQFLAGLQRIDYLFVDPEGNDLVIAGPAEGFAPDGDGRIVGVTTRRPPLRIDDLIVALRSADSRRGIGVSIDPVPAQLDQARRFLAKNSSATSISVIRRRFKQLAQILGQQTVSVWGVPPHSHFAQTLVEADVQMKHIAVGLLSPPVPGLRSHLSLLKPQGNSMQRWWATPLYEAIHTTGDRLAFQLVGQRAQVMAQEELLGAGGKRIDATVTRVTTRQFAKIFTEKFPLLADRSPVFAQLQNLIDLTILVALLHKEQLPKRVGWSMEFFLSAERARLARGETPTRIASIYNTRTVGSRLILGLVSGGVVLTPRQTIQRIPTRVTDDEQFSLRRRQARATTAPTTHPWWWD
ncbi:MAG: DUF1598 domain-containing protein [Planctomycetaceae bacterium]|nr:DUF1598 domain-containing protein [Planctomycetaceae bacterium]